MSKRLQRFLMMLPLFLLGAAVFVTLGGLLVRFLWNWLLPPLFGWPALSFWQALAMLALCRILFGGFGMHGAYRGGWRRRMQERYQSLTPEERERFRERMRERWGFDPAPPPPASQG